MDHAAYAQKLCEDVRSRLAKSEFYKQNIVLDSIEMRQILAPTPAGIEWVVKLRAVSTAYVDKDYGGGLVAAYLKGRGHETLWISIEWTE